VVEDGADGDQAEHPPAQAPQFADHSQPCRLDANACAVTQGFMQATVVPLVSATAAECERYPSTAPRNGGIAAAGASPAATGRSVDYQRQRAFAPFAGTVGELGGGKFVRE